MLQPAPFPPPYIRLDELRRLLRPGRKMSIPDHVAQAVRDRNMQVQPSEAPEIAAIAERLAEELRNRLHDEGFDLPAGGEAGNERMPKRDRNRAENLAVLLTLLTLALTVANRLEEAERYGREGIGWSRMSGSAAAEVHLWINLSRGYNVSRRSGEEEGALNRALEIARRSGKAPLIIAALNELVATLISRDRREQAAELLQEAVALAEAEPDEENRSYLLAPLVLSRGRIAAAAKEQEKAIAAFREALRLANPDRDPIIYASLLSNLGTAYGGLGDEHKALECFSEMVRAARLSGDAVPCAWGYFKIGELHTILREFRQAEKAFELSLEHCPEHYPLPRYYVLFKQSEICLAEERIEEGIALCNRILEAGPESWSPSFAVTVYIHLGLLEEKSARPAEAEETFRRSIDLCRQTEAIDRSANAKVLLAKLLLKEGKKEEAETLIRQVSLMEPKTAADDSIIGETYRLLSQITEEQGDLREALRYSRAQNEQDRMLGRRQNEEALRKARILAEVELLEREAQLERERRRRAEQELAAAVFSLKGKNDMLEKVERQLHHVMSGIVAEKAREITLSLKRMIEEIDTGADEESHPLNYIRGIDQEFFLRLRARWPDLTRKQERLCALIRSGLTTQETAAVLSLSYEGVRALRKRLRKQLGISPDESLERVITEV